MHLLVACLNILIKWYGNMNVIVRYNKAWCTILRVVTSVCQALEVECYHHIVVMCMPIFSPAVLQEVLVVFLSLFLQANSASYPQRDGK